MGTTLVSNDEKKIDKEFLLKRYFPYYDLLEDNLRNDAFITILVKNKKYINSRSLKIPPETPLIFKIFPMENKNYLKYSQEFNNIKIKYSDLKSTPNILPLLKLQEIKDLNVGILVRQYIKYNLNDIQYHMHCVSEIEKKWVCFQLLHGLNQIHSIAKCHGDIKPNNILLTSKLSVFLTDISVYKPAYLPIEDLQSYNIFFYSNEFDKSCYLAPERFIKNSQEIKNQNKFDLTPEMDIFSLGVIMSEIFLEKFGIFTQTDIINYKNGRLDIKEKLNEIKEQSIKTMLKDMIDLNPKNRPKLSDLINLFNKHLCPSPVIKFMIRLNIMIVGYEYYNNDLLVALLYKHFEQIWKCLCLKNKDLKDLKLPKLKKKLNRNIIISLLNNSNTIYKIANEFPLAFIPNKNKEIFFEKEINEDFFEENNEDTSKDCEILIVKYLLSCMENTRYISTYSVIFEMLFHLSKILITNENSVIILDIIVPYYLNLFNYGNTRLNIEVFNALIDLLSLINYDKLILNQIDYNIFNNYIFEQIYNLFLQSKQLEVQCSIISRLDEIIELENNFLFSYLNTINFITCKKEKENQNLNKCLYNSIILFQSLVQNKANNNENKKKKKSEQINFNDIYKSYLEDQNDFKKKLKIIVENVMTNNNEENPEVNNDCLKLMVIQKYKEICMFCGNYNENKPLFNHLCMLFNWKNYFIQKEIIRIFPSLILLYGRKLYLEYFLPIIEGTFQNKNSELMIIEIIDSIYMLTEMNLISHDDDYSQIYSILIPYFIHPNYLLRYKLNSLFYFLLSDERNSISKLYISFYNNIKKILNECKPKNSENDKKMLTILNIIDKGIITSIKDYCKIPREIFLLYKYNIESDLFKTQYSNFESLLDQITKVKKEHFFNKIQKDEYSRKNLGLVTKKEIKKVKKSSLYEVVAKDLDKILKNIGGEKSKDSSLGFINNLTFLLSELNENYDKNDKNLLDQWYKLCGNKKHIIYSNILYLLKVLNIKLDKKNIDFINFMPTDGDNINKNCFDDFDLISQSKCKSINLSYNYNILNNTEIKGKLCYDLLLNESESIIKLIPVNNLSGKNQFNMFISISDEGIIRLHKITSEANFDDIHILKNKSQYQINCGEYILKTNNISYIEQPNKITLIIAIKKKLQLITIDLSEEKINKNNMDDIDASYSIQNLECKSLQDIISIENIYNNKKNYLTLGHIDNTISFYNYTDNKIDYINNCSSFPASFGNIEFITTLSTGNILITTSFGYIVLFDFNLRLFTYVYSFTINRKIKQIEEFIPQDYNDIFELNENQKLDNEKVFIYILTEDNNISLLNLSLLKPIIVCQFYKNEDNKNKGESNPKIIKITKYTLEKTENNSQYEDILKNDCSNYKENEIIKMNIPFNYYRDCSYSLMLIGDLSGNIRIFRFSNEILNKIKKKESIKNNKFNQIIISN